MERPAHIIAMGQGIIGEPRSNFCVKTSVLQNCVLICGANSNTNKGGAFHYPSHGLDFRTDAATQNVYKMNDWLSTLEPDEVFLLYSDGSAGGPKASPQDVEALAKWVKNVSGVQNVAKVPGVVAGGMILTAGGALQVGKIPQLWELGFPTYDADDLTDRPAGRYALTHGTVLLFGDNLER